MDTISLLKKKKSLLLLIAGAVILFFLFNILTNGAFFTKANLLSLLRQPVYATFLAWGVFLIFTSGVMDMSTGANMMFSANIGAILCLDLGLGYVGAVLGAVISGVLLSTLSMFVCVKLKIPSWISSLGMAMVYEALLNFVADVRGGPLPSFTSSFRALGQLPVCLILWAAGLIVVYTLYNKTYIGLSIRALGSNVTVAENMGLNRNKALILSAVVGGIFVGLAAAINMSYSGTIRAVSGMTSINQLFKPIAAWMLAKAFEKEINLPIGILLFSFFITAFFNFLTFMGAPTGTVQDIALGVMVLLFAALAKKGYRGVIK